MPSRRVAIVERNRRKERGFTLIEVLLVVGIVLILSSLVFFSLKSALEKANAAKDISNLKQIGVLLQLYAAENNNTLPLLINWQKFGDGWWQDKLRRQAGLPERSWPKPMPEIFYDAGSKNPHPMGGYGGSRAFFLDKDSCEAEFGQGNGLPLIRIPHLSEKVVVCSSVAPSVPYEGSWYFETQTFVNTGTNSGSPKPYARNGKYAPSLFLDGHVESLDINSMDLETRRKYFSREP
jgi:prepilin-type N-terminal cleavage/methylation domain-containing protein/prepilin-type processing-associated H-X9-DG protein